MFVQNCQDSSTYNIGTYSVDSPCHNGVFFLIKDVYIIAWTYLLNLLCKNGFKTVSWALVLLPFVGMFIAIGLLMFLLLKRENFEDAMMEDDDEDEDGITDIQDDGISVTDDDSLMDTNMGDPMGDPMDMDGQMDMDPGEMDMDEGEMDMGEGEMDMGEGEMDMGEESFKSQGSQWPQVGSFM